MSTEGETARSPKASNPLQPRGPGGENPCDPLVPAELLPMRQSVVEETPAENVPTSALTIQEFTPSESEKSKAEAGARSKDVKTTLQVAKTQSLTDGASGTRDTSHPEHTEKRGPGLQTQSLARTRSQMTKAGLQYKNLPGQVTGPVQLANSKGNPMQTVPPQVQRVVTSPNDINGQGNFSKENPTLNPEITSRLKDQAGISPLKRVPLKQPCPGLQSKSVPGEDHESENRRRSVKTRVPDAQTMQTDPEHNLFYDPFEDDHLETFADPYRRPYAPLDHKVESGGGEFNNLVNSPVRSDVTLETEIITQIVKAKLEGRLEETQTKYYPLAGLVKPVRRYCDQPGRSGWNFPQPMFRPCWPNF